MVSITQKNRSCVLLLLSLTQSILPPLPLFFFTLITVSVWPALALAALRTPKVVTPPVGAQGERSSTTTQSSNYFSLTAVTPSSSPRDVLITSTTASTKAGSPQFGKKAYLGPDSPQCRSISHSLKQISRLLPHSCKHLTLSHKKNLQLPLSKTSLYPASLEKHQPAKSLFSPSNPTVLPNRPLPPASTSSSPMTFLSLISKTSPPPPPVKISPVPLLKASPSPPEETRPRPPPPQSLPHTTGPLFEHQPFIVSWNIPDLVCNRYKISLDTSPFKGVATPAKVRNI